ncbi:MAG: hypothetical protein LBB22_03015, partial [Treponema sp.]|nr:hypothetical protein [Treponema sp.]
MAQAAALPAQEFKVSPIWFISPDEKDKGVPVFMEKTTEYLSQRTKEIVLMSKALFTMPAIRQRSLCPC